MSAQARAVTPARAVEPGAYGRPGAAPRRPGHGDDHVDLLLELGHCLDVGRDGESAALLEQAEPLGVRAEAEDLGRTLDEVGVQEGPAGQLALEVRAVGRLISTSPETSVLRASGQHY